MVTIMTRPRYTVTNEDKAIVEKYIADRLAEYPYWVDNVLARSKFNQAKRSAGTLNSWCEQWLDGEQWRQLKGAVRMARKRQRDKTGDRDPVVNVSLSRPAWRMLRDLAKYEGLTLSAFIESRFKKEWLKLK
jgi:macrodomain Ter protein organizer (MatP/YcbG family)